MSLPQIPEKLALDAAVSIPDNFVTAFWSFFGNVNLNLPIPKELPAKESPPNASSPILVYGAGSSVGQYSIQLLNLSGYTSIIATASPRHHDYLRAIGAHHVFDYKSPTLAGDIIAAAGGKVPRALDCVSATGTLAQVSKVIADDGAVAIMLPIKEGDAVRGGETMHNDLPESMNSFSTTVKLVPVRTFGYQQVCLSAFPLW